MKKVKQVWYTDDSAELSTQYATGLILELEDGTILEALSTDFLQPYAKQKGNDLPTEGRSPTRSFSDAQSADIKGEVHNGG